MDEWTDTRAVDAIATYLGTREAWSAADAVEVIADIIGTVRPHPGHVWDTDDLPTGQGYLQAFAEATGYPAPGEWDGSDY